MADLTLPDAVPWLEYRKALEQVDAARERVEEYRRAVEFRDELIAGARHENELLHQVACGLAFDAGRRVGELETHWALAVEIANRNAQIAIGFRVPCLK